MATQILRKAVALGRSEGIDRILVTCADDNIGSAGVIERGGGVFEGTVAAEDGRVVCRHWI